MSIRGFVKTLAEMALIESGVVGVVRRLRSASRLVLAYHNVVPDGAEVRGDRSLHLPVADFRHQLDALRRTHVIVPLIDLLELDDREERPHAAITFDDAYCGAVTCGVRELGQRGLAATIFISPAFVGGGSFWWDSLADPAQGLSSSMRERALDDLRGEDSRIREWAAGEGNRESPLPAHAKAATLPQLQQAAEVPGITFGSHTWSHPNLAGLLAEELAHELSAPMQWIQQYFPAHFVPIITYPYGATSPLVELETERNGYRAGFRVTGGELASGAANPFALPRLNIPAGISLRGFLIRTGGLMRS